MCWGAEPGQVHGPGATKETLVRSHREKEQRNGGAFRAPSSAPKLGEGSFLNPTKYIVKITNNRRLVAASKPFRRGWEGQAVSLSGEGSGRCSRAEGPGPTPSTEMSSARRSLRAELCTEKPRPLSHACPTLDHRASCHQRDRHSQLHWTQDLCPWE